MALTNLSIRARMGIAFGAVLIVVAVMMATALGRVSQLEERLAAKPAASATAAPADDNSTRAIVYGLGAFALLVSVVASIGIVRSIESPLAEAVYIAETVAAGDLSKEFETERGGDFGRLLGGMGEMEDMLTDLVTRIKAATDAISVASHEIAAGNTDLSQRTEEQAATLEETASSMSELTSMVKLNTDRARTANGLAGEASGIAERGGALVGSVVETMEAINTSSRKVTDIIAVIEGIAFQTNILALNAAVEAARAGEQGRGFAVVAGEVRTLAQRSAAAAKEINVLISDSARQVESGSALVGQAGATMQEIVHAVRRVTQILGEIATASDHQSAGIAQVNEAVAQMDTVTQQNAALVEQAAAASAALASQAQQLQSVVGEFKLDDDEPAAARSAARPSHRPALAHA
ncbi:methyl-accepting chemotaxis protein [Cupriavidus plantarum]|uniref:Methyl-accepting chemotaxis protein n=1 Tax=Cupriavidus plantarum TaxID=942865 RepID=A0A316ET46_9BURK|nr:methyl-accepting chemotaxis protein [Cupriavidus plantarum]PWK35361.1 methyl-accepting chemotaxis protein [Cupriavidus plantarum]